MSNRYKTEDLCRLAKRYNNTKRSYLIVDPLQAKHMPISPSKAIEMMLVFGNKLSEKAAYADCIIAFAETATAIGTVAAMSYSKSAFYIQTTREKLYTDKVLYFSEEHSHASEQKLAYDGIDKIKDIKSIVIIDDELTTGKTLLNMIKVIKTNIQKASPIKYTAGALISRLSDDNSKLLKDNGINVVSLISPDIEDDIKEIEDIRIKEAANVPLKERVSYHTFSSEIKLPDLSCGLKIGDIKQIISGFISCTYEYIINKYTLGGKVLILGTEECMYPALMLGKYIEDHNNEITVYTHSTTRSPIGICNNKGYPCKNGYRIRSFYEKDRVAYIYNTDIYETVIVVTDSMDDKCCDEAMMDICSAFDGSKCFLLIKGR